MKSLILIFIGFVLATLFNESQQAQEFGGTVFQANSKYSTPKGVKIQWMNFLLLFGVSFDMTMESNDISETNFKITMEMTAEEFDQSITLHPTLLEPLLQGKTAQEIEEIKNFRLAIGFVNGVDFPGGSIKGRFFPYSVGPNGEKAVADRFAIFYKNGTYDFDGKPGCAWYNQLPQGFSCGIGSPPIEECNGGFERFVPVSCDELVLKVAKDERCPRAQVKRSVEEYNLNEFNSQDCFVGVHYG